MTKQNKQDRTTLWINVRSYARRTDGETVYVAEQIAGQLTEQGKPSGVCGDVFYTSKPCTNAAQAKILARKWMARAVSDGSPLVEKCYACDAAGVGICDRTHDAEGGFVPACARHKVAPAVEVMTLTTSGDVVSVVALPVKRERNAGGDLIETRVDRSCAGGCGATIQYELTNVGPMYSPELHPVGQLLAFSGGHLCRECEQAVSDLLWARRNGGTKKGA